MAAWCGATTAAPPWPSNVTSSAPPEPALTSKRLPAPSNIVNLVSLRSGQESGLPSVWPLNCCFQWYMLWIVFISLVVLWLLGLATSYTFGGFIHLLLVIALTVL